MPIAWHSKRWTNYCMSEDDKSRTEPIFTGQCFYCASLIFNCGVPRRFGTENCIQRRDIDQKSL